MNGIKSSFDGYSEYDERAIMYYSLHNHYVPGTPLLTTIYAMLLCVSSLTMGQHSNLSAQTSNYTIISSAVNSIKIYMT